MTKIASSVGKYKIVSIIAKGGMGVVYKAIHPTLKRYVITKKLTLRGDAAFAQRFKREASLMMDFKNEHIVDVYDHFREGSSYYIVMEFVDGISLDKLIKREGPLPNDVALLIFFDACRALKYAHDRNVVHRDIKPGNILISKKGEVKLTDFGIAAVMDAEEEGITRDGATLGTPSYMAPEQFENAKSVDKRADIYSLGVMLYEMMTSQKPFPGGFSAQSIVLIQRGKYKSARKVNPKVSRFVNGISRRCMRTKPPKRFPDLGEAIKLVYPRLKKLNLSTVRRRLVGTLRGQKVGEVKKRKPALSRLLLVMPVILLLLLMASAYFFYSWGYFYELLMPRDYGSLIISTRVRKDIGLPDKIHIGASLFLDDGKEIPRIEKKQFIFKENREKETESHFYLESKKVYLKSDLYRVKVNIENEVFWDSLFLNPRELQRKNPLTGDARIMEIELDAIPPLPLDLEYRVIDEVTGRDITARTNCFVLQNLQWIKWSRSVSAALETGSTYQLKFGSFGYYPKYYNLAIGPYESRVDLRVSLRLEPGSVKIVSNYDGIKLSIDDSQYYVSGGHDRSYRKLQPSSRHRQEINLSPGQYLFKAEYSPNISREVTLNVSPGTAVEVNLSFDRESESLELTAR